jgi:hypothetical protein
MGITTGSGPHANVMTPPLATAATTAAEVQLSAVPLPTTVVGCEVSTACAAAGTAAWPSGLPNDDGAAAVGVPAPVVAVVDAGVDADDDTDAAADDTDDAEGTEGTEDTEDPRTATGLVASEPQAAALIAKATATSA